MALKDWDDVPYGAADCVSGHVTWENMVDYIKHSGSCSDDGGFTLYDDDDSTTIWFEFYQHSIDFMEDRAIYINDDETYIGHGAGDNIGAGTNNTLVGHDAGQANDFFGCAFFGYEAGKNNTRDGIVAVGYQALQSNTGAYNTAIGYSSMKGAVTGGLNTAVGKDALVANTSGMRNTGIGVVSLNANTNGNYNTAIGWGAGLANIDTSYSIYLGYLAGAANVTSNRLYINNSGSAYPLIYGEFDNDKVKFGNGSAWFVQILSENGGGQVFLKECTTPTTQGGYGALYTKADNKLYFQSGDGNEHEVTIS